MVYWDTDDERAKALGLSYDDIDAKLYESLEAAAKHPSPTYYQLTANLLTRERKSDEAIAGLQQAIVLDPSDSWTFEAMAQTLIHNGRPKEALAYLDAAVRLDPAGVGAFANWRPVLYGFAAFGEDRFEDAVASLKKIDLRSPEPWAKFYGLQLLLSAYGHLGRTADAAALSAQFDKARQEAGEADYNRLRTQRYFVFKHDADLDRLLDGLAKVGIPELPADVDPHSKDRLTETEIQSLFFGHEAQGHQTVPEAADYKAFTAADGSTTVTIGSWVRQGMRWTQAGCMCASYPKSLTSCAAIYRNPSGTFERKNEYLYIGARVRVEFSVVK
jgi:tetratricopeptide (TPR) repeat protein